MQFYSEISLYIFDVTKNRLWTEISKNLQVSLPNGYYCQIQHSLTSL